MSKIVILTVIIINFSYSLMAELDAINIGGQMILRDDIISVDETCKLPNQSVDKRCRCCIVDGLLKNKAMQETSRMRSSFTKCLTRNFCNDKLINDMRKDVEKTLISQNILKNNSDENTRLSGVLNYLIQQNVPIKDVQTAPEDLNTDGKLTDNGVSNILTRLCASNQMSLCPLNSNCLKVKDVFAGVKGWATDQLFIITSTCGGKKTEYVLKGMPTSEKGPLEALALNALKSTPFSEISWPNYINNLPILALPLDYIKYKTPDGKRKYLSLMPMAQGRVFLDYIKAYTADPSEKKLEQVRKMFKLHGQVLAAFHKKFAKKECAAQVFPHMDLHAKNIYYDDINHRITFIDNDQLGKWASAQKFPVLITEAFWSGGANKEHERNYPVKDMRIIWDTLQRSDFHPKALEDKKFVAESIKAFMEGYQIGWGDKAACAMATIKGKDRCLDSLINTFERGKNCAF